MKKTKITLYEEDKKEEASMRCSLLHGSWDQILRRRLSVCLSVCLSICHTFFTMFLSSYHNDFQELLPWTKVTSMQEVKVRGQRSRSQRSKPKLQFEFTYGYEMKHKNWSSIEEVPYYFSRSSIKFQGHMGQKFADFDLNWAFPDCNSSLNSQMVMK